jgi:hypothetical protein
VKFGCPASLGAFAGGAVSFSLLAGVDQRERWLRHSDAAMRSPSGRRGLVWRLVVEARDTVGALA